MTLTTEEKAKIAAEEKYRAEMRAKSTKQPLGCFSAIIILIVFIALVITFIVLSTPKSPPPTAEQIAADKKSSDDRQCNSSFAMAYSVATKHVKINLKAPSTATFPSYSEVKNIKNIGKCTYLVSSYVDAENSFGAKIRNNFQAKVVWAGGNEWVLLDLKMED